MQKHNDHESELDYLRWALTGSLLTPTLKGVLVRRVKVTGFESAS